VNFFVIALIASYATIPPMKASIGGYLPYNETTNKMRIYS